METKKGYPVKAVLTLLLLASISLFSCQKEALPQKEPIADKMQAMNASVSSRIDFEDVIDKLPQSVLYNLGTQAKFDFDHVEWTNTENYLLARIPTNGSNGYIYITQENNDPADVKAYMVQFIPDAGFNPESFSGKQTWIDLQDWHYYGIIYKNDAPISYFDPVKLARPDWEVCALVTNHLQQDFSGVFGIDNGPVTPMNRPNYDCPGEGSFWKDLGEFYKNVKDWVGGLFGSGEGGAGAPPGNSSGAGGGAIGGGGYGGFGGGMGAGGIGGGGGSGYGGGSWHGPNPGNIEDGGVQPIYVGGHRGQGNASIDPTIVKKTLLRNRLNAIKGAQDEFQFTDIPQDSPHMTAAEFQDMLNQPGTVEPPIVLNATADTKVLRFRFNIIFVGGVDCFVNLTKNGSVYDLTSVASDDWGAMLASSWSQLTYSNTLQGNTYTVDIYGYRNWTIFVEGVGTIYKQYCQFRVKFNTNGNPISGQRII